MSKSRAPNLSGEGVSVIGRQVVLVGTIKGLTDVEVLGTLDGGIDAHHIRVAPDAVVTGQVNADEVIIGGKLTGRVKALHITVEATADVEADLQYETIAIAFGARVTGRFLPSGKLPVAAAG
jgi:cytoskeletal protein CcmA (bactofilin family)